MEIDPNVVLLSPTTSMSSMECMTLEQALNHNEFWQGLMAVIGSRAYLISAELRSQVWNRCGKCAVREPVTSP